LLVGCAAQRPAYDQNFSAADFGMGPLAPEAEASLTKQSVRLFALLQQDLPASIQTPLVRSLAEIQGHAESLLPAREAEVNALLAPYRNLTREPVGYYQMPQPANPALQAAAADTNLLLKRYYRMLSGIKLSEALLPQIRTDVSTKTAGQPVQQAATGLAIMTDVHLLLQAQAQLDALRPDMQAAETAAAKALNALREQVKANPTRTNPAVERFTFYSALASNLSTASQNLNKIKAEFPAELADVAQLSATLAGQI